MKRLLKREEMTRLTKEGDYCRVDWVDEMRLSSCLASSLSLSALASLLSCDKMRYEWQPTGV
jgi:hypothetical protein